MAGDTRECKLGPAVGSVEKSRCSAGKFSQSNWSDVNWYVSKQAQMVKVNRLSLYSQLTDEYVLHNYIASLLLTVVIWQPNKQ